MMLDFEKPIIELEERIGELRNLAGESKELQAEIARLEDALEAWSLWHVLVRGGAEDAAGDGGGVGRRLLPRKVQARRRARGQLRVLPVSLSTGTCLTHLRFETPWPSWLLNLSVDRPRR